LTENVDKLIHWLLKWNGTLSLCILTYYQGWWMVGNDWEWLCESLEWSI